jgi:Tat protein secretion system quality control protein TatD with DNase activity
MSYIALLKAKPVSNQCSFLLKAETFEAQLTAILFERIHYVSRNTIGEIGLDFERHLDVRAVQGRQVLNHLFHHFSSIACHLQGADLDGAIETMQLWLDGY